MHLNCNMYLLNLFLYLSKQSFIHCLTNHPLLRAWKVVPCFCFCFFCFFQRENAYFGTCNILQITITFPGPWEAHYICKMLGNNILKAAMNLSFHYLFGLFNSCLHVCSPYLNNSISYGTLLKVLHPSWGYSWTFKYNLLYIEWVLYLYGISVWQLTSP